MVHALNEIRRVLVPDGIILDLRPLLDRWPVEVAWHAGNREVGRAVDLQEPLSDDAAANAAMRALMDTGDLKREREELFPLFYYWDAPKEMQAYIADEWSDVIRVEDKVWQELGTSWATANAEARVRLRMKMLITRYRKAD